MAAMVITVNDMTSSLNFFISLNINNVDILTGKGSKSFQFSVFGFQFFDVVMIKKYKKMYPI